MKDRLIEVFLLGLIVVVFGKQITELSTPLLQMKFNWKQTAAPSSNLLMEVEGRVEGIFGNPREDVMVIIGETGQFTETDEGGEYHFSNIPNLKRITLRARYGKERGSRSIEMSKDADTIQELISDDKAQVKKVVVRHPLVLQNPDIKVELCLCLDVHNKKPLRIFEGENPEIPLSVGKIYCYVRVFGPLGYETNKITELTFSWYYEGELMGRYSQSVGFNPAKPGWRTYASKYLNKHQGNWRIDITAKHKRLGSLHFNTY